MTTDTVFECQNPNSDKERVLAYVNVCNEGASILGTSISTQIPRSRVESILKELVTEGRAVGAWSSKNGYGLYYPPPEPKVIPRFDQADRLAAYEHKVDAGEIPTPDPVLDRAAPDHFPRDDGTTIPCERCAKDGEEFNAKSSLGMSIHLSKHHGIKGTSRTGKGHPHTKVGADIKGTCRHCHRELPLGKVRQHEPVCGKNPDRNGGKSKKSLREDPGPFTKMVLDAEGAFAKEYDEAVPEPIPEPVPFDDTVPPLSAIEPPKDHVPYPFPEEQSIIPECGEACTIVGPSLVEDSRGILYPVPKDPLVLFAQQHRLRVGREISKLKRIEKKLRRRAASLETMAERVHDARQIKERELRRFDRELREMA